MSLVANEGTIGVLLWNLCGTIETARIVMPRAMVRFSPSRITFLDEEQAMCFMAGANSIFMGDKLLTTPNNDVHLTFLRFRHCAASWGTESVQE